MIAIPAIDIINGKVVRLFQGDYAKKTSYEVNPLDYAKEIKASGLEYLHLVDLSGAKKGRIEQDRLMTEIVKETGLKVDFGGGVKAEKDVRQILGSGAKQAVIGSLCVKEPQNVVTWIRAYGQERIILALDTDGTNLKINGWQKNSRVSLEETMKHFSYFDGLTILTTDIRRDGTGTGPSIELYKTLVETFPKQRWIASGGVESISDLEELRAIGCYGCVVGKALLDGKISLKELKEFNDAGL